MMRGHGHENEIETGTQPKGERPEQAQQDLLGRAAAEGRADVLGPAGLLGLQRLAGNAGVGALVDEDASPVIDVVNSGGGTPLDTETRADMESRFGQDFSDVRVHTDGAAHESATAVNANAYTVGSNIVFQRGKYDPSSGSGKHTLAHELTHVVQQRNGPVDGTDAGGGVKVSDPSDRFEREAVANADRVMSNPEVNKETGAPPLSPRTVTQIQRTAGNGAANSLVRTQPGGGRQPGKVGEDSPAFRAGEQALSLQRTGPVVQRAGDISTKKWAEETNGRIERVQDALTSAKKTVSADGRKAVTAIRATQTTYDAFEKKYDHAMDNFKSGVESAQAKEKEMRDNISFVAGVVFGYVSPFWSGLKGAFDGQVSKIASTAKLAGSLGLITKDGKNANDKKDAGGESDKHVGPSEKVNWKELLNTTITSFESTLQQNESLEAMAEDCIKSVRFLRSVAVGTFAGSEPQSSAEGAKSAKMADQADKIIAALSSFDATQISGPAEEFQKKASDELEKKTVNELEQNIAIKWMSSLTGAQLDEIDTAEDYLKMIGLIDKEGNRLNYDTGAITTDLDERIIQMLARVENAAMAHVGQTAEWLGGKPFGESVGGRIRDGEGHSWNASATKETSEQGGGYVQIISYSIRKLSGEYDSWEWELPAGFRETQEMLYQNVTFRVVPSGPTGGGGHVPEGEEGPAIGPGR